MKKYRNTWITLTIVLTLSSVRGQMKEAKLNIRTDFLIYTPKGYQEDSRKEWPLLINLHGADYNVSIENIQNAYLPYLINSGKELPMVVVNPVCNKRRWNVDELDHLLDEILERYNVDSDRVYLSGFSMGGYGTWDWVFQNPRRFAAISPIAGCAYPSDLEKAWRVRSVPIWIIHGEKDTTVEIECSHDAVETLKQYGAKVRTTFYPDIGHKLEEIWGRTLTDDDWYEWLLAQDRQRNVFKGGALDRKEQRRYVGTYVSVNGEKEQVSIFQKKGQLFVDLGKGLAYSIHAESDTLFAVGDDPVKALEFKMEGGEIRGVDFLGENRNAFKKVR